MRPRLAATLCRVLPCLLLTTCVADQTLAPRASPRNGDAATPQSVVVIMADDMRFDHLQYMPLTMAQLGSEAVVFSNAVASTPLCCPSRSSILTGRYAHNHGVLTNFGNNGGAAKFNPSSTVATWLDGAGYRTGMFGKYLNNYYMIAPAIPPGWDDFQVIVERQLSNHYFDYDVNENGIIRSYGSADADYGPALFAGKTVDFINSTPADQALLALYVPYAPHAPAIPHPSDAGRYADFPDWRPPSYNEAVVTDKAAMVRTTALFSGTQISNSDALHRRMLETLQSVDRGVAAIILALKAKGRWSNALVFFLSDNGLSWGENRMLDRKSCPYEACIRIPFMVRAPGGVPRTEAKWASNVDLAPTIAAYAGVTAPANVNGRNLLPLLANPGTAWRTEVLIEQLGLTPSSNNFYSVRKDRWSYTEFLNGEKELYDLTADPYQLTNVVNNSRYYTIKATLAALLQVLKTTP
jgi:N-acetylglucosamine-6-sulfatase